AGLRAQKLVRELDQDARAVPGVGVGALSSAVLQALERGQCTGHDLVRCGRSDPCDEGDAAGVVLVARVVQATRCLQWVTSCLRGLLGSGARRGNERETIKPWRCFPRHRRSLSCHKRAGPERPPRSARWPTPSGALGWTCWWRTWSRRGTSPTTTTCPPTRVRPSPRCWPGRRRRRTRSTTACC